MKELQPLAEKVNEESESIRKLTVSIKAHIGPNHMSNIVVQDVIRKLKNAEELSKEISIFSDELEF